MQILLASASSSRARLLSCAGVDHEVMPARIDEAALRQAAVGEGIKPRDLSDMLAEAKARKIALKHPERVVLGSDQILSVGDVVIDKSDTEGSAKQTLLSLQGRTHRLYSSAVIYAEGEPVWRAVGEARMTMHTLSERDINAYLHRAWPEVAGAVGAYHAEGYGARLFSRIDGDWFSVIGLPLLQVMSFLRLRGWLA